MKRIKQLRIDIAENRVPGGSAFARAGAELIALTLEELDNPDWEQVREMTFELADWLTGVKPSMAGVRNLAEIARAEAARAPRDSASDVVIKAMYDYIKESESALEAIGKYTDVVIPENSTVLVHSFSASLVLLLTTAASAGTHFDLLVTESRPYRESRRLVDSLTSSDISITLVSDASVCIAASMADRAVVGADTVFRDGSFANKTGSLPLALACRYAGIPMFVATEMSKLYRDDPADIEMELRPGDELASGWTEFESGRVKVLNQFFERVEASLVTSYVTEAGVIAPSDFVGVADGN